MFETACIPVYLDSMGYKQIKAGKDKFKGTKMTLRIDPLTPELAAELSETKRMLFRRDTAEANTEIDSVAFTYVPKPQAVEFYPDPAIAKASCTIAECKVGKFKVRKPKDGSQWVLTFQITFIDVTGDDMLYLKEALFEQRFLTFENAVPGLFDEAEREARKSSRIAKPVRAGGAGVQAH
jgi:hypothetical protein